LCAPFSPIQKAFNGSECLYYKENPVGRKLYVGNLTDSVTPTNLEEGFAQHGTVQSARVITDPDTGCSKRFGFVEVDTNTHAQAPILGLHDQDHDGRRLTVDEAKPRAARTGGGYCGGRLDGSARTGGGRGYGGSGLRP
jgi:RNA recognition motif-containing protein